MLKNLFKKKEKKSDTTIGSMNIDSKTAGLKRVESSGALIDTAEELEEADIEATKRTTDEGVEVIELGSGGSAIGEALPETTNVNPDSPHAKKFFTEAELEAMKEHTERFRSEDLESAKKVRMALDSAEYPDTRQELWTELCKQEEKFGRSLDEEKELTEAEKDRKLVESMRERGYDAEYSHPSNKSVSEMNGKELRDILNGSEPEEEELSQAQEEETEEEVEIETVPEELAQAASEAFAQRGGYWSDIAEDLSVNIPDTKVESMPNGDMKKVTTSNPTMIEELKRVHKSDEYDTKLHKEGDNTYVGVIPTGVEY